MLDLAVLQSVSMPKAASSSGESEAAEFPFQETLCPLSRSKNPSKPNCQRTQKRAPHLPVCFAAYRPSPTSRYWSEGWYSASIFLGQGFFLNYFQIFRVNYFGEKRTPNFPLPEPLSRQNPSKVVQFNWIEPASHFPNPKRF
jgi:hypothetical protein